MRDAQGTALSTQVAALTFSRPQHATSFHEPYPLCTVLQVEECQRNLAKEKEYYRRYRVCKAHATQSVVHTCGEARRYCQQCSVFHAVHEFDGEKRSAHGSVLCPHLALHLCSGHCWEANRRLLSVISCQSCPCPGGSVAY